MVHLLGFYDEFDWEVVAEVVELQAHQAAEALKRGEWHSYTSMLVRQAEGPLRKIIVPNDYTRKSKYKLFQRFVQDERAAIAVKFEEVKAALYSEDAGDLAETLPIV